MRRETHVIQDTPLPNTPYRVVSTVHYHRGWLTGTSVAIHDDRAGEIVDGVTFPTSDVLHPHVTVPQDDVDRHDAVADLIRRYASSHVTPKST